MQRSRAVARSLRRSHHASVTRLGGGRREAVGFKISWWFVCPLFVTADSSGLLALRMSAALGTACPGSALGREWVRECVGRVAAIVVYARRAHVGSPPPGAAPSAAHGHAPLFSGVKTSCQCLRC